MIETATYVCSICDETSTDICVYCTKDTCSNHRCLRCLRCSDCCECEVPLTASEPENVIPAAHFEPLPETHPQPEPQVQPEPVAAPEPEVVLEQPTIAAVNIEVIEEVIELETIEFETMQAEPEAPEAAAVDEVQPESEPFPSRIDQATTTEELVRALPELFAPEPPPPPIPPRLPEEPAEAENPAETHQPPDESKS